MVSLPLPFVVSLLIAVLGLRQWLQMREAGRPDPLKLAFLAMASLTSIVVGLRWAYGWEPILVLRPVMAATLPPLAHACYAGFARLRLSRAAAALLYSLPVIGVAVLALFWRPPLDLVLALTFASYGAALLKTARRGPDAMDTATLESAADASHSARVVGWLLIASAGIDVAVAIDFRVAGGIHAGAIVAVADLGLIFTAACVMALSGGQRPAGVQETDVAPDPVDEPVAPQEATTTDEDATILASLADAMTGRRLFLDPDLTLDRLARKVRIPARQISAAINRATGGNVSAYVNAHRVREAQRLLEATDRPVTAIMFDAGFQTKSNFNKEFRRVSGMSPSDYRRSFSAAAVPSAES